MHITAGPGPVTITASAYSLTLDPRKPRAELRSPDGELWSDLSLICSVDAAGRAPDESWAFQEPEIDPGTEEPTARIVLRSRSSIWADKAVVIEAREEDLAMHVEVTAGQAAVPIGDVTLLGGRGLLPSGASGQFRSSLDVGTIVSPNPTQPLQSVRPVHSAVAISANGDAEPGRLNAVFSPAPFVVTLRRESDTAATALPVGDQLAVALRCGIDQARFTRALYEPLDGGWLLRLDHEGHTHARGTWTSPAVVLRPVESVLQAITDHRADLAAHGMLPVIAARPARWHLRPIFCGWGAQCARAADVNRGRVEPPADSGFVGGATAASAPTLARQDLYDEWLEVLRSAELNPGTVVIDDRWQAAYGTNEVDTDKWPDLPAWIRARHAEGRRVLLWWKAWDPENIPGHECLRTPDGQPVAVDPASPAYVERMRGIVEHLLGPAGLDADGFKLDFTQRMPTSAMLRRAEDVPSAAEEDDSAPWGAALLHRLLKDLREASKAAKPDALVVTQTPNPLFADVTDMVRLNDVFEYAVDGSPVPAVDQLRMRAAVASTAVPGVPLDTDQWPLADRSQWLEYVRAQGELGVPALYYLESIDNSGEVLSPDDLGVVREAWSAYSSRLTSAEGDR